MAFFLGLIGWVLALAAAVGCAYQVLAGRQLRRLLVAPRGALPIDPPGVTLLKPLHGAEAGLGAALTSFLAQDYPGPLQVIFGVQDRADPALAVVAELQRANPARDIAVVVDPSEHGANRKVSNVINMMAQVRHEVVVLADSDIVVRPGYLRAVVATLGEPGIGVVTCAYYGLAARGFWSRLAAMGVSCQFLPSVAVGVGLGMAHPCMGSTIALRREVLDRIGGFEAFADQLADDYAIGAAIRGLGLRSRLAPVLVGHACSEASLAELVAHELRWARTIRGVDPAGFAGSVVTYPTPLALLAVILSGGAGEALAALAAALIFRLWLWREVGRAVGARAAPWWLTPLRDGLSFAVFIGAFFVRAVDWRGTRFRVDAEGALRRI